MTSREGVLWAWGSNDYGELGDGTTVERACPVPVRAPSDIIAIEAGPSAVHVLRGDGTVWGWGYNLDGKLGDGTEVPRRAPVQVKGLTDVVAIASWDATYALKADGSVWAWGSNHGGQLGDGTESPRSTPGRVAGLPKIVGIAASGGTGFALAADGTVWAWGDDGCGELGGAQRRNEYRPAQVLCFKDGQHWTLERVTAICAGIFSGYALRNDGTVWSWGANDLGQLGNGETINAMQNLLAATGRHNAASPVLGLSDVVAISSKGVTAYALRSSGTVWAWGSNEYGQLGTGSTHPRHSTVPVQVRGLTGVTAISSNGDSAYALRSDGTVWAWGENDYGELGDGTHEHRSRPVLVVGLRGVTAIAAGIIAGYAMVGGSSQGNGEPGLNQDVTREEYLAQVHEVSDELIADAEGVVSAIGLAGRYLGEKAMAVSISTLELAPHMAASTVGILASRLATVLMEDASNGKVEHFTTLMERSLSGDETADHFIRLTMKAAMDVASQDRAEMRASRTTLQESLVLLEKYPGIAAEACRALALQLASMRGH